MQRIPVRGLICCKRHLILAASKLHWMAVILGQSHPRQTQALPIPVLYSGRLHDDVSLAMVGAAADVVVVPSRMDNLLSPPPKRLLVAHLLWPLTRGEWLMSLPIAKPVGWLSPSTQQRWLKEWLGSASSGATSAL